MSSLPPDPWKALGVERNADKAEIRAAYKKLVLKCHPDKVQDATLKAQKQEEFQKVQQAWELLNDDAERAKYEAQLLKLATAKSQDATLKNSANTSVPRSSPATYYNVNIRTAEPTSSKYKNGYSSSSGKMYANTSPHTRSNEEVPSPKNYAYEEGDVKTARRAASYDKVGSKRDEERREKEDRRRKKEEEELRKLKEEKEKERQRERERLAEKEKERERKKYEKMEKERRRESEEKRRQHTKTSAYVEPYAETGVFPQEPWVEDEEYVSRSKKERSSSTKKHDDLRDRDRQRERERERDRDREREKSATRRPKSPERKHLEALKYIKQAGGSAPQTVPAFWKSETPPDSFLGIPAVPTPPPVDLMEEESILRSAKKAAAARRPSHDASKSHESRGSKDKLVYGLLEVPVTSARSIPIHHKSGYSKAVPESSPPRMNRSNTTPHEASFDRAPPPLSRHQTWAAGTGEQRSAEFDYYASDEDRERRHRERRSSRRNRSPGETTLYKIIDGTKSAKVERHFSYGESPSATRRHTDEALEGAYTSSSYGASPYKFKVTQSRRYGPEDVSYSNYEQPASSYNYDNFAVPA